MKIQVRLNNYRRSARKVREISSVLKGMSVNDALNQLEVMQKGSAYDVKNLLISAIATAENDFHLNRAHLILKELMVQEGKTLKRWRARAYGRANQILKRTCHILLTLEEIKSMAEKDDTRKSDRKDIKKMHTDKDKKMADKTVETPQVKKSNKKKIVKK